MSSSALYPPVSRKEVEDLIDSVINALPEGQRASFKESVSASLLKEFDHPRTSEAVSVLGSLLPFPISDDDYRSVLFFPDRSISREGGKTLPPSPSFYPLLISQASRSVDSSSDSSTSTTTTTPTSTLHIPFLVMMYLCHIPAPDFYFTKHFIFSDGLAALTELMALDNLHIRGQAIDSFLQITSHPSFDWFCPFSDLPSTPRAIESIGDYQQLHAKLLSLNVPSRSTSSSSSPSPPPSLLQCLSIHNSPMASPHTFPGGSFLSLQVLAFYISWLRALHTPPTPPTNEHFLRLSPSLLSALESWTKAEVYDAESGLSIRNGQILKEEHDLAVQVHADFSASELRAVSALGPDDSGDGGDGAVSVRGCRSEVPADWAGAKRGGAEGGGAAKGAPTAATTAAGPEFIPSETYGGAKTGYIFKKGSSGVGYYKDVAVSQPASSLAPPPPAASAPTLPPAPPLSKDSQTSAAKGSNAALPPSQREIGNAAFANGDYEAALQHYGKALAAGESMDLDDEDAGGGSVDDDSSSSTACTVVEVVEKDARAVLHCNRAACYLKLVQRMWALPNGALGVDVWTQPADDFPARNEGLSALELCEAEARAAVAHDPNSVKGHFRLAQALALRGSVREAVAAAKIAADLQEDANRKKGSKAAWGAGADIDELIGGLLKRIHLEGSAKAAAAPAAEDDTLDKEAKIMSKILGRKAYGQKLRAEEREMNERKERAQAEKMGTIDAVELGAERASERKAAEETPSESNALALVPAAKKKASTKFVDEDSEGEDNDDDDDDGYKRGRDGRGQTYRKNEAFTEILGDTDSDDDDVKPKKKAPPKAKPKTAAKEASGSAPGAAEDIKFVKKTAALDDILSMGRKSTAKAAADAENKGKEKGDKERGEKKKGIEQFKKMAKAAPSSLDDFMNM